MGQSPWTQWTPQLHHHYPLMQLLPLRHLNHISHSVHHLPLAQLLHAVQLLSPLGSRMALRVVVLQSELSNLSDRHPIESTPVWHQISSFTCSMGLVRKFSPGDSGISRPKVHKNSPILCPSCHWPLELHSQISRREVPSHCRTR